MKNKKELRKKIREILYEKGHRCPTCDMVIDQLLKVIEEHYREVKPKP